MPNALSFLRQNDLQAIRDKITADIKQKILNAQTRALENALQQFYSFLLLNPIIPRDTGLMMRSAINHLFENASIDPLVLDIWYDTYYAGWVNNNALIGNTTVPNRNLHFLERTLPYMDELVINALKQALESEPGFTNVSVSLL